MKLVAVSVVKNEADIIEVFVRHTHAWVDHHLVFDHDSTDGTRQILAALVREGLPLTIYTGDHVANLQQARSNHLAKLGFTEHGADWVLPLDADEILVAPSRAAFEAMLVNVAAATPATVLLRNYSPSNEDAAHEPNPVLRILHRKPGAGTTAKAFVPRALGLRDDTAAGKGNHALYRDGQALAAQPLGEAWLAHFALRSPHQQVLRVATAELQKLSRGRAHEGLDLHYRLGFQLLSEDPELFFSTVVQPARRLHRDPAPYLGGELRHQSSASELTRSARALMPFLEKLAVSHGHWVDGQPQGQDEKAEVIRPLDLSTVRAQLGTGADAFTGFEAVQGWEREEGPVPEAFLPRFHWATGPETHFTVRAKADGMARLEAQALSYAENQVTTMAVNGREIAQQKFPRVNQKEAFAVNLPLRAGDNRLVLRHTAWIESAADPRKLALIFLTLRIIAPESV